MFCVLSLQMLCRSTDLRPKNPTSLQLSGAGTVSRQRLLSDEFGSAFCDGRTLVATLTALLSIHVLKFSPIFTYYLMLNSVHWVPAAAKLTIKITFLGNSKRLMKGRKSPKYLKSLSADASWFRVKSKVTVSEVVATSTELLPFKISASIYAP